MKAHFLCVVVCAVCGLRYAASPANAYKRTGNGGGGGGGVMRKYARGEGNICGGILRFVVNGVGILRTVYLFSNLCNFLCKRITSDHSS